MRPIENRRIYDLFKAVYKNFIVFFQTISGILLNLITRTWIDHRLSYSLIKIYDIPR